jgi:hypothetical protein
MSVTAPTLFERLLAGDVPRTARLAAARGALPLSPIELAQIQVQFLSDADSELAQTARESLAMLPIDQAIGLANDLDCPAVVLDYLAEHATLWAGVGPVLAGRPKLTEAAAMALANSQDSETLSNLAWNQVVIGAHPQLGSHLSQNPALPERARGRLIDLLEELDKAEARRHAAAAPAETPDELAGLQPARDPFLAALGVDAEVEALLPMLELDIGELAERSELIGGPEDDDDASVLNRLSRMNVGQKLRVALFGTSSERAILVRDSNRLVAAAVVKNPKFTEQEAEAVSKSRNVNDVVIRLIARHKDFGSSYSIQHNLVRNPRCPVDLSLAFMTRLNDKDIVMLAKNRNVSEAVRRHAKKLFESREERRRVRSPGKKH